MSGFVSAEYDVRHYGRIVNWKKYKCKGGCGYMIFGVFLDHLALKGQYTHTRAIIEHNVNTGEIRTNEGRYTLVRAENKNLN